MSRPRTRRIVALLGAAALLLVSASPTLAYRTLGYGWGDNFVEVCIDQEEFSSSTRRNVIAWGFYNWDSAGSNLIIGVYAASNCSGEDVEVRKANIGNPAQTQITNSCSIFGCDIIHAKVTLDSDYANNELYWGDPATAQQCQVVYAGCNPDAYTIFTHEAGHAFGISHNTSSDSGDYCNTGWFSTNDEQACDATGEKVMLWNVSFTIQSGNPDNSSGYRHELTFDDKEALRSLYGTP